MQTTLAPVTDVLPEITRRAAEIEASRELPADLLRILAGAGCLRMLAPASHGGDERTLPDVLRVIEQLACADGATGWTISQVASAQLIFAYFPRQTVDEIYARGPDVFGAGAVAPKGRAYRQPGGWHVSGQWPFVTGCRHASWVYVQCITVEDRKAQFLPNGLPAVRMMLFPAGEVNILDTWHVAGLRGTGSHDARFSKLFCPDAHSTPVMGGEPSVGGPVFRIPLLDQGGLFIAAVALGTAAGAVDEIAALARGGKRPAFSPERLAASPVFQDRLGEAFLELRAARALLYEQAEALWAAAQRHTPWPLLDRAALRATPGVVVSAAARVVDTAYTLAGGSAIYDSSPLQRRLRDVHTATQHVYVGRYHLGLVGALLAGEKIDDSSF